MCVSEFIVVGFIVGNIIFMFFIVISVGSVFNGFVINVELIVLIVFMSNIEVMSN